MKQKKAFSVIIYTAIIFAGMLMYCFINGFALNDIGLYSLFLGDFSIGICSRLLVGSVISIFKETITREWLVSFLRVVTALVFLSTAYYAGSTLPKAEKTCRKSLSLFILLFIICPFSITVFAGDIFGFIDVFCMIILIMTAYFAESKTLIYAIPLLMIAGVFIHDSYITGYMAPCLGILAYVVIRRQDRPLWRSPVFISSAAAGFASSFYTLLLSRRTIRMSVEEMLEYLAKKGDTTIQDVSGYLEDMLMWTDVRNLASADVERTPVNNIIYMFRFAVEGLGRNELIMFISIIPVIALIFTVWIKAMKNANGFTQKLPYVLFMLTPVPQLVSLILSIDFTRFLSTILISQTFYILLCIRQKDSAVSDILSKTDKNLQYFALPVIFIVFANLYV